MIGPVTGAASFCRFIIRFKKNASARAKFSRWTNRKKWGPFAGTRVCMSDWPFILPFARRHAGQPLVLATLLSIDGSSYRPPGARLLIAMDGSYAGSISGGCLEDGIAAMAPEIVVENRPRLIHLDTRPHFGCPGMLHILVEPLDRSHGNLIDEIEAHIGNRQSFHLRTSIESGTVLHREFQPAGEGDLIEKNTPVPRLIAFGWTPDMEPVLQMAGLLGWELHRLIRDHRMLGEMTSVAGETITVCPPDEISTRYLPDEQTAVLLMSHHLASDLAGLVNVFDQPYAYIGLLGSKRRRETLLTEVGNNGMLEAPAYLDRFHAPAGLDLGRSHPAEIALSIVAEIQQEFRRFATTAKAPIPA